MLIELQPIGFVKNNRHEIADDNWGEILSEIELSLSISIVSLDGIDAFSHLAVIFYMDRVQNEKAIASSRHPRNMNTLPKIGTYAQRNKNRPNKLGLSNVELIQRRGRTLQVKYLDAINGTPVLDIKPIMQEFQPKGVISQPDWTRSIMNKYW